MSVDARRPGQRLWIWIWTDISLINLGLSPCLYLYTAHLVILLSVSKETGHNNAIMTPYYNDPSSDWVLYTDTRVSIGLVTSHEFWVTTSWYHDPTRLSLVHGYEAQFLVVKSWVLSHDPKVKMDSAIWIKWVKRRIDMGVKPTTLPVSQVSLTTMLCHVQFSHQHFHNIYQLFCAHCYISSQDLLWLIWKDIVWLILIWRIQKWYLFELKN